MTKGLKRLLMGDVSTTDSSSRQMLCQIAALTARHSQRQVRPGHISHLHTGLFTCRLHGRTEESSMASRKQTCHRRATCAEWKSFSLTEQTIYVTTAAILVLLCYNANIFTWTSLMHSHWCLIHCSSLEPRVQGSPDWCHSLKHLITIVMACPCTHPH